MKSDSIKHSYWQTYDGSQKEFSVHSTGQWQAETGATIDAKVLGTESLPRWRAIVHVIGR